MKNYPHILAKVLGEPWAITKEKHFAIQRLLEKRMEMDGEEPMMDGEEREEFHKWRSGDAAVIPVYGIIGKHLSSLEMMCGGCDVDTIGNDIDAAVSDSAIRRIVFDFRTPGGTVTGVPELARKIANCPKPTMAYTDSECCSAGYWLASQCQKFYATESATVGSIGVYAAVLDYSKAMEREGVNVQAVSAGKYKLLGAYWKPLTAEELAMLQKGVDKTYSQFTEAIRRFREVPDEHCQGQVFDGMEAAEHGLIDGVVEDLTEALG